MLLANIVMIMSMFIMAVAIMFLALATIYLILMIQYFLNAIKEQRLQQQRRELIQAEVKIIRSGFGRQRTSSWPL